MHNRAFLQDPVPTLALTSVQGRAGGLLLGSVQISLTRLVAPAAVNTGC